MNELYYMLCYRHRFADGTTEDLTDHPLAYFKHKEDADPVAIILSRAHRLPQQYIVVLPVVGHFTTEQTQTKKLQLADRAYKERLAAYDQEMNAELEGEK